VCTIDGMLQNGCYALSIKGMCPFPVSGYSSSVLEDACWVEQLTMYRTVFVYMICSANSVVKGIGFKREELRCAHIANETFIWKKKFCGFNVLRPLISYCKITRKK